LVEENDKFGIQLQDLFTKKKGNMMMSIEPSTLHFTKRDVILSTEQTTAFLILLHKKGYESLKDLDIWKRNYGFGGRNLRALNLFLIS
jgi:hypothetical protein